MLQHNQQQLSIQASTVNENPAMPEAADLKSDESPLPDAANDTLTLLDNVPTEASSQNEPTPPTPDAAVAVQSKPKNSLSDLTQPELESKLGSRLLGTAPAQKVKQPKGQTLSRETLKVLPAYSHHPTFIDTIAAVRARTFRANYDTKQGNKDPVW